MFELVDALRKSRSTEYSMIRELVGLLAEDARKRLVDASQTDMLQVQGEARALAKLYRQLTETPPQAQE
jgi:hypothetical protein